LLRGDRDQPFLLPPDLRDWPTGDHLAWFILDVVDQVDLAPSTESIVPTGIDRVAAEGLFNLDR
jgi:hypothetical protein